MWMVYSFVRILFPPQCFGCGKKDEALCKRCLTLARKSLHTPAPFITSCYDFKDPLIKRAIHAIKYKHRKELLYPLTLHAATLHASLFKETTYSIVPVPMTRLRKLVRGYNHAEEIAFILGKIYSLPVLPNLLQRTKSTRRQASSPTKELRRINQKGSFSAQPIQGATILLIDDVTTTGATLEEARLTLLQAGAQRVNAFTLAH